MRNSSFELLRIFAMVLITCMHVASMGTSIEFGSFNHYILGFISSIGNIGVTCFVLITGYFGAKCKPDKIIHLIYLTTLYQVISYLFNLLIPGNNANLDGFMQSIFIIPLYKNWFISCYLILMLISPYLETFVKALSKKDFGALLLILFVCFSLLPTMFNTPYYTILTAGGKCLTYFIFIYLIGRYLKMHPVNIFSRKKLLIIFIASTLVINLLNISVGQIFNKPVNIFAMDCSPFILISALAVFLLFKSFTFHSAYINWISTSILAVYLLDSSRIFWDYKFFKIDLYASSPIFVFVLLLEVLFLFVVFILIDKIRNYLFSGLEQKGIDFLLKKVGNWVSRFIIRGAL